MGTKGVVKKYSELSKRQKADVRKRMKPPYAPYIYKIYGGKVSYRVLDKKAPVPKRKQGMFMHERESRVSKKTGRVEAYSFGEGSRSKDWPFS